MTSISVPVDRGSPVPLYFQVAQRLEHLIESGELPPGTRLDNEIDLADQLGLSRPTMRRAIEFLVERGLLVRKRGVGTRVVHAKVRRPVELSSLYDDLAKTGRQPRTRVLSLAVEPASDSTAAELGVHKGSDVYVIERLRFAGDEPLALMRNQLPAPLVHLTSADLAERGLYEVLRSGGVNLRIARQTIGARCATAAEAHTLDESTGTPLLTMQRTSYDDHGRAVEYGDHLYIAARYSFELTLTSNG